MFDQGKVIPAKNILKSMINHLEAVEKRKDFEKSGISREEAENLIEIINKVKFNI